MTGVHIRLAEPFWRIVGQRELELELKQPSQVSDLLALLFQRYPKLEEALTEAEAHIFLGDEEVDLQAQLTDGAQVHLVWPIAGG